jgi:predicted phosphodiesterase
MRETGYFFSLLIFLLLILPSSAFAAGNAPFLWGPYVTGTDGTTAVISWKTAGPSTGNVSYATADEFENAGGYAHTVADHSIATLHHVRLTTLSAGTTYFYAVTAGDARSPDCRFMTAGRGPLTFAVYSDTRGQVPLFSQMERHRLVADRIAEEENLSFVIHCGDFVTFGNDLAEWDEYFAAAKGMLSNTTLVPSLGNHEGNRTPYYDAFGVPEWYSFDWGDVHVVVLDSNDWAKGRIDTETSWLETDLARSSGPTFVAFHHPVYSSNERHWGGDRVLQQEWAPLFDRYNVTAVFNGHVHAYERYEVNGTQYFVVPCGGEELFPLAEKKAPGFENGLDHTLAYLRVCVDGERVTVATVPVASISEDNKEVVALYPPNSTFETVEIAPESEGRDAGQAPLSPFCACAAAGTAALVWLRKER